MNEPPSLFGQLSRLLRWLLVYVLPIAVILLLPFVPAMLGNPSPWGIPAAVLALAVYWLALSTPSRYDATTVGEVERVDVDTFTDTHEVCAACHEATDEGLYKRYARQWVLAGVPVRTLEWGINAYCPDCIDPETLEVVDPVPDDHDGTHSEGTDETELDLES